MPEFASKSLPNAPLAEAIFELRWELQRNNAGVVQDPLYSKHQFAFAAAASEEYKFHQPLPAADVPPQLIPYQVQHRFRSGENDWPLLQIGPGIFSANETEKYEWEEFQRIALEGASILEKSRPSGSKFTLNRAMLRYIDAIEFDASQENVLEFLGTKLKTKVSFTASLFEDGVDGVPDNFIIQSSFPSKKPEGRVLLKLSTGTRNEKPALVWETSVVSEGESAPGFQSLEDWINTAHSITHDWFAKLAEGDLMKEFKGD